MIPPPISPRGAGARRELPETPRERSGTPPLEEGGWTDAVGGPSRPGSTEDEDLRQLGSDRQPLVPSSVPLVGAQIASFKCSLPCCFGKELGMRIDPDFVMDMLWAFRCACGVMIAALPTFWRWSRDEFMPGLDLAYAAVTYVFVTGRTLGETIQLIWQATMGSITAAIAPQLAINTFPDDWDAVAVFVLFYTFVVLALPLESITKKFALGTTLQYLMHSAKHSSEPQPDPALPSTVTYEVLLMGLWGCVPALLFVCLPFPYPRLAIWEAQASADKLVLDIKLVVGLLLHGYCEGLSALDRTRLVKHFADMEVGIANMSRSLGEAWYEPHSSKQVTQLSTVLRMVYKLRAELYGMQQALTDEQASWAACANENIGAKEQFHDMVMSQMRRPMMSLVRESLGLLVSVVSLINNTSSERFRVQSVSAGDTSLLRSELKNNLARQSIKKMIEELLDSDGNDALHKTQIALRAFHFHLSKLRDETKELEQKKNIERAERVEMDSPLMMFVFSVTGFSQQLLEFSDEYAITMEQAQQKKSRFSADTQMVALQFQRKQLVAAVKTAMAVTAATTFNATASTFNYEATAPVLIAYLMAGHVGSSYENTISRVLGVVVGTIMSFCVLIFAQCNVYWRAVGFVFIIFLTSFVRFTSPHSSYVGLSAAVAACIVLVRDWDSCGTDAELSEQYSVVRQVVLSCSLLVVAELFWPSAGATNLQKKISDTLTECKQCFQQLSVYNAAQYGELSEEGAKVDPKKVELKLWGTIPANLREQSVYLQHAKSEPTVWRTEFPASAFTRVVNANIRISIHMMLLRNAWKRLNLLAKDKKQNGALMIDHPHVKAKSLDEEDPRDRRVEVIVKAKIQNLEQIRDVLRREARAYDVVPSFNPISGLSKTEVMAHLPVLDRDAVKAQEKARELREKLARDEDIALQFVRAKDFSNEHGRTEIHVPAARMLTRSHQDLLMATENTDSFELNPRDKGLFAAKAGIARFSDVHKAVTRVKWLHSLGRNDVDENWRPADKGVTLRYMLRDELQFDFKHGNVMDQVNILSDKVQACFTSVAEDLRFNSVYEKANGEGDEDGDAYFQTQESYYDNRKKHVSTQLRSEVGELVRQFKHALRTSLHISSRELPPSKVDDASVDWAQRARDNEDLLVFYGICKNYESLVEALLETDSVMFNGDDLNFVRNPRMLHAHAWTAQDLANTFSPAGQGPSWYRLGLEPNSL